MKITDSNHMREQITSQCAKIDGNADLFHRVHLNFAKYIKLCIKNYGNHVENMFYQHDKYKCLVFKKCVVFLPCAQTF